MKDWDKALNVVLNSTYLTIFTRQKYNLYGTFFSTYG